MMTDAPEIPADVIERCAKAVHAQMCADHFASDSRTPPTIGTIAQQKRYAKAVLSAAGWPELMAEVASLKAAHGKNARVRRRIRRAAGYDADRAVGEIGSKLLAAQDRIAELVAEQDRLRKTVFEQAVLIAELVAGLREGRPYIKREYERRARSLQYTDAEDICDRLAALLTRIDALLAKVEGKW